MKMRALPWLVLSLGMAVPQAADAGEVRGVLRLPALTRQASSPPNAYPGQASALPQVPPVRYGYPDDAVVSIENIPAAADAILARTHSTPQLAQKDQSFVPRVLPIALGTQVRFPNFDPIFHNVFSVSPVRRFDLGKYPRGQSRSVTFRKTGVVQVYCDIHANMAAYIVVLPNHAFTQPDAQGVFSLPDLPAGRYILKVWHPDLQGTTRRIEIPETGELRVEVDLGTPGLAGVESEPSGP